VNKIPISKTSSVSVGSLEGGSLEDLRVGGIIILEWVLQKNTVRLIMDSSGLC
jgi:hypothetical protein